MSAKKNNKEDAILQLPLHHILEDSNTGILITEETDTICWINKILLTPPHGRPELRLMVGKKLSQGLELFKEFHQQPDKFKHRILTVSKRREPCFGIKSLLINEAFSETNYIPVFSDTGRYMGAIWQSILSDEKEDSVSNIKNSESSFIESFGSPGLLCCHVSPQGDIVTTSSLFNRFMGYPEESLTKMNLLDCCYFGKENLKEELLRTNPIGSETNNPELGLNTIEGIKWVRCTVLHDYEKKYYHKKVGLLFTDITAYKELQEELEKAKEKAEKAQIAQQQFLASMSHDIRTPLNAIIGMTMLMEENSLTKKQKENFKVLKNASDILLGLLNDILDFAKIETGQQEIHETKFDLHRLVRALVDTFSFRLEGKPIALNYKIDPQIKVFLLGDTLILNQVLMNLLTNAEKFTEKGTIRILIEQEKKHEQTIWIKFQVEDTGIGISKKNKKKIFQDFKRVSDIASTYDGSGLGLFIAKKLVDLMGGNLKVESTLGEGSSFYFSIPFEKTSQPLQEDRDTLSTQYSFKENARLLVIEDNPMNISYLSALLEKENLSFDIAENGKEGERLSRKRKYDLILTDLKLPGMDGIVLTSSIRQKTNPNHSTPIVLFSAVALKETAEQARKAGINDFLSKPFTPQQLLQLLQQYLLKDSPEEDQKDTQKSFQFDDALDTPYLNNLYADNLKYAENLFRIFLEEIDTDIEELSQDLALKDWKKLRELGHKIKPNFSMVGLTQIAQKIQKGNDQIKAKEYHLAIDLFTQIKKEVAEFLPLIRNEHRRLATFLSLDSPNVEGA